MRDTKDFFLLIISIIILLTFDCDTRDYSTLNKDRLGWSPVGEGNGVFNISDFVAPKI